VIGIKNSFWVILCDPSSTHRDEKVFSIAILYL